MDALTTYKLFAANTERTMKRISNEPVVAREVAYYQENIGSIVSAKELIEDRRLFDFALKAYGLQEMNYARAFFQKILEGGVDDDKSLANQLTDPRYKEFAEDFNFARYGAATTSFDRTQSGVVEKYYQQTFEQEAGIQNTGARLAIYFERKSLEIEDAFDILGDRALLQVVQTAFGLPPQMSFSSLDRQAELINERLNIDDLKNPELLSKLVTRFIANWDLQNPDSVSVPPLVSTPLGSQGLSLNLLSAIQNIKLRP